MNKINSTTISIGLNLFLLHWLWTSSYNLAKSLSVTASWVNKPTSTRAHRVVCERREVQSLTKLLLVRHCINVLKMFCFNIIHVLINVCMQIVIWYCLYYIVSCLIRNKRYSSQKRFKSNSGRWSFNENNLHYLTWWHSF